jgi:hypothetical protein
MLMSKPQSSKPVKAGGLGITITDPPNGSTVAGGTIHVKGYYTPANTGYSLSVGLSIGGTGYQPAGTPTRYDSAGKTYFDATFNSIPGSSQVTAGATVNDGQSSAQTSNPFRTS